MSKIVAKSIELGGRTLTLETGRLAEQSDAAVLARHGDTMVLATVVSSGQKEGLDYFPLSVDYIERLYAGGRIKGSRFIKREGRPSDEAILAGRLIDRSIRPLFPKDYFNEVQVIVTVLSVDMENSPEVLAGVAVSAALAISSVPWKGPISMVKVGLKEGVFFVNPQSTELEFSELDLTVASTKEKVLMIETQAKEVTEDTVLEALRFAKEEGEKIVDLINSLREEVGKAKQTYIGKEVDESVKKEASKIAGKDIAEMINKMATKEASGFTELEEVKAAVASQLPEEKRSQIDLALEEIIREQIRKDVLAGKRVDGRKIDQIREISLEVGVLPRTHGSAIFKRGETQVLTVATLGGPSLEQLIEGPEGEETKRYIHHYSMPPFSSGETGRVGTPSRREIGHGALAEKALVPVIPENSAFPYTIRLVSEVMSSNGSTSMASTCGSTLALMDAGVPIKAAVAGLAIGLVDEGEKWTILSDIIGLEDHYGDMDFKVTGSEKGITTIQLDVKNTGLTDEILQEALKKAKEGRLFILGKMFQIIEKPRTKISQYAPKVVVIHIPAEKIGEVIGPGGKIIRKILEETKAAIDIEDDGTVNISAIDEQAVNQAVSMIEGLTREVKPGETYEGEVKRIQPFGAFVEVSPGKEGLVHVSQMAKGYVANPSDIVSVGQKVQVRVIEIDDQGRINLTMLLDEDPITQKRPQREFPRQAAGSRFMKRPQRPRFPRSRF